MTLTSESDLDNVKANHHVKHLGRRSSSSNNYCLNTETHIHPTDCLLYLDHYNTVIITISSLYASTRTALRGRLTQLQTHVIHAHQQHFDSTLQLPPGHGNGTRHSQLAGNYSDLNHS